MKDKDILIGLLILVSAVLLIWIRGFIFTEHIIAENVASEYEGGSREHVVYLTSDGEDVAHVNIRIDPLLGAGVMRKHRLSVWHVQGTRIESLRLSFSGATPAKLFTVYLETPQGGRWKNISTYSDGGHHVYISPDLGLYRSGTINLDFITEGEGAKGANLIIELDIRGNTPVSLTRRKARASITLD